MVERVSFDAALTAASPEKNLPTSTSLTAHLMISLSPDLPSVSIFKAVDDNDGEKGNVLQQSVSTGDTSSDQGRFLSPSASPIPSRSSSPSRSRQWLIPKSPDRSRLQGGIMENATYRSPTFSSSAKARSPPASPHSRPRSPVSPLKRSPVTDKEKKKSRRMLSILGFSSTNSPDVNADGLPQVASPTTNVPDRTIKPVPSGPCTPKMDSVDGYSYDAATEVIFDVDCALETKAKTSSNSSDGNSSSGSGESSANATGNQTSDESKNGSTKRPTPPRDWSLSDLMANGTLDVDMVSAALGLGAGPIEMDEDEFSIRAASVYSTDSCLNEAHSHELLIPETIEALDSFPSQNITNLYPIMEEDDDECELDDPEELEESSRPLSYLVIGAVAPLRPEAQRTSTLTNLSMSGIIEEGDALDGEPENGCVVCFWVVKC